ASSSSRSVRASWSDDQRVRTRKVLPRCSTPTWYLHEPCGNGVGCAIGRCEVANDRSGQRQAAGQRIVAPPRSPTLPSAGAGCSIGGDGSRFCGRAGDTKKEVAWADADVFAELLVRQGVVIEHRSSRAVQQECNMLRPEPGRALPEPLLQCDPRRGHLKLVIVDRDEPPSPSAYGPSHAHIGGLRVRSGLGHGRRCWCRCFGPNGGLEKIRPPRFASHEVSLPGASGFRALAHRISNVESDNACATLVVSALSSDQRTCTVRSRTSTSRRDRHEPEAPRWVRAPA